MGRPCGIVPPARRRKPTGQVYSFSQAVAAAHQRRPESSDGNLALVERSNPREIHRFGADRRSTDEGQHLCVHCHLPLGDWGYAGGGLPGVGVDLSRDDLLHGECKAQRLLRRARDLEEAHRNAEASLKSKRRVQYGIGWDVARVRRDTALAGKFQCPQGRCCLVLKEDEGVHSVQVVPSAEPTVSVNMDFLSIALQVRRREGREPMFSLDPEDSCVGPSDSIMDLMQEKHYEPSWLAGTSVGEVMFQADYHLKELSMGAGEPPIAGMRSALDFSREEGCDGSWRAREWFVVKGVDVLLAEGDILVPHVRMGVEAREQSAGADGWQDVIVTRPNHPMVKYAEAFTHFFDLIAERRSVIYHLRELAKAAVLAKFLLDYEVRLDDAWFDTTAEVEPSCLVVPQLWNESYHSRMQIVNGKIVDVDKGINMAMHGAYGGVMFGLEKFNVLASTSGRIRAAATPVRAVALPGAVGVKPPEARAGMAMKQPYRFNVATPSVPAPAQGVDLNLDSFSLCLPEPMVASAAPCVSAAQDAGAGLLTAIFNPKLSDRHAEGELFATPAAECDYFHRLRSLICEEEALTSQRMEHFLGKGFSPANANPLFPSSWVLPFGSDLEQDRQRPATGGWTPSDAEALGLESSLKSLVPWFDRGTEDGTRYRIYQVGDLEVRTTAEPAGKEVVGAVFSTLQPAHSFAGSEAPHLGDRDVIVKAKEFVESLAVTAPAGTRDDRGCHYYVVFETDSGHAVMAEKLEDGRLVWEVDPRDLEVRNSLARVTGCIDCRGVGLIVRDVRRFRPAGPVVPVGAKSRCYAQAVFSLASPTRARSWEALARSSALCADGGA